MAEMSAELRAWLQEPAAPVSPLNVSDIIAEINAAIEPAVQAEAIRNGYIGAAGEALNTIDTFLQPMATIFAELPGFENIPNPGPPLSFEMEPADGRKLIWSGARAWIASQGTIRLWSGVQLRLYEGQRRQDGKMIALAGRLRIIAEHVIRAGQSFPSRLWMDERWVPVGSAQQSLEISNLVTRLGEHLRLALYNFSFVLKSGVSGYFPPGFPAKLPPSAETTHE